MLARHDRRGRVPPVCRLIAATAKEPSGRVRQQMQARGTEGSGFLFERGHDPAAMPLILVLRRDRDRAQQHVGRVPFQTAKANRSAFTGEAEEHPARPIKVRHRQACPVQRLFQAAEISEAFRLKHGCSCHAAAPLSYQPREAFTILTTDSMTGTSISTPTTVARAAPDWTRRGGAVTDYVFPSRIDHAKHISTRQYARLVEEWVKGVGLRREDYGTHSLRRTKAAMIYKQTGNLRAVQMLLGHTKIESTVRYLGVDVEDALTLAERTEI